MKFLFVGGSSDGRTLEVPADKCEARVPKREFPVTDKRNLSTEKIALENYVRLAVKGGTDFFMVADMTPLAGLHRWKELTGLKQPV